MNQAMDFCRALAIPFAIKPSSVLFSFGSGSKASIGILALRITLLRVFLLFHAHVVRADIPFLLGLDVMSKCGLLFDFDKEELRSHPPPWSMPLTYGQGHAFAAVPLRVPRDRRNK